MAVRPGLSFVLKVLSEMAPLFFNSSFAPTFGKKFSSFLEKKEKLVNQREQF